MKLELDIQSPQNSLVSHDSVSANGFETGSEDAKKLLRSGIKSAKDGNRVEARQMLLQVTEVEPNNETAWLWLASISEYPEELLVFLQNVLKINPANERAIEWEQQTKSLLSKTFVQRGINASHQNQKEFAKQCFLQGIVHDEQNEMAWLWLASSTDSPEEKISHLQKVLNINPENETAFSSLKAVRNQVSQSLLKKANSAAVSGNHESARQMLEDVMRQTPMLEDAWILKAFLANDYYEKIACYERVLEFNPNHDAAQAGLAALKSLAPKVEPKVEEPQPIVNQEVAESDPVAANEAESLEMEETADESNEVLAAEPTEPATMEFLEESAEQISQEPISESTEEMVSENHETQTELNSEFEEVQMTEEFSADDFQLQAETQARQLEDFYTEPTVSEPETFENNVQEQVEVAEPTVAEFSEQFTDETAEQTATESESMTESTDEPPALVEENQVETQTVVAEVETSFSETVESESTEETQAVVEVQNEEIVEASEPQEVESAQFSEAEQSEVEQVAENKFEESEGVAELASEEVEEVPEVEENTPAYSDEQYPANGFAMLSPDEPFADYQQPTVELSYLDLPAAYHHNFEPKAENSFPVEEVQNDFQVAEEVSVEANQSPAVANYEFATQTPANSEFVSAEVSQLEQSDKPEEVENYQVEEPQAIEAQDEVPTQVFSMPQPQVELATCPFCEFGNQAQAVICDSCQAMLSLSDLEMLLAHQGANQDLVLRAIEQMEVEKTIRDFSADELQNLGVAHLNVHNLRKGFSYLQEASQLNPNDVVIASKVNFLAIRLSEIEEQDQKAQENPVQSRTILVVDDSPTVRKLISGKLEKSGHSVVSAVDGMDALAKINEVIPDLILLDITMPRLDGYQVCKLIRNNPITKDIPVVMISGKDGFFDKVRGRMAGSTGYITKPFGPDTLMKTIETYLA